MGPLRSQHGGLIPMFVADHYTTERLQELTRALPQKRIWRRAQAVVLAKQGRTARDIADSLGCPLRAATTGAPKNTAGGMEPPPARPRGARPPLLDPAESPRLRQRLDAPPRPEDGVCALRGVDV